MGVAGSALAAILIKLAIAVLSYYQGRADYKELIERELENAGLKRVAEVAKWMVGPGSDSDGELRVRQPNPKARPGTPPTIP